MAHSKSARKATRIASRKRMRNKSVRSAVKTHITKAERLITAKELDSAKEAVVQASSALDRAAQKGVIHPNNAARHKLRLMKKLNQAIKTKSSSAPSK